VLFFIAENIVLIVLSRYKKYLTFDTQSFRQQYCSIAIIIWKRSKAIREL